LFVFIPYATILKILSLNVETSRWHPRSLKLNKNCVNYYYHHQFIGSKHDRVTCATKQSEHDIKDNDATNSCPRKVQVKKNYFVIHFNNKEKSIDTIDRLKAFSVEKFTLEIN